MCTVSFYKNNAQVIITSNRDEHHSRAKALPPQIYQTESCQLIYCKDAQANGTWMALRNDGATIVLLNGAFERHQLNPPYKKSRGLMLLDFFLYNEPEAFLKLYDFSGIEAFTLILAYSCSDTKKVKLYELRWDEEKATLLTHDSALPQIWSSVTLYTKEVIEERKGWFEVWLSKHANYTSDTVLFFHHFGGNGIAANDLLMERFTKKTVSICCINKHLTHTDIIYEDLLNKKFYKSKVINC